MWNPARSRRELPPPEETRSGHPDNDHKVYGFLRIIKPSGRPFGKTGIEPSAGIRRESLAEAFDKLQELFDQFLGEQAPAVKH
jgi:hypothetical protein